MTPWEYQRNKAIHGLTKASEGTEFSVSVGERFMVLGRQGYIIYAGKRLMQFFEGALVKIAETKEHYQPVLVKAREILKSFDELLDLVDKADKINKLKEGVTEGEG
jgi:hypothetical protein